MIDLKNVSKKYTKGAEVYTALENVSLRIAKGDFVAISGASGAGKSTLLNLIGGLIKPSSGEVFYNGTGIYRQEGRKIDIYRKKHIGFMFQQFHLMPYLTVYENIALACYAKDHNDNIEGYLESCSLKVLRNKYPDELSVGEKQRVAFIRAIISDPEILLADEPTGNLDPENSKILMNLIHDYHGKGGTVILVSHDSVIAEYATRLLILEKGRIQD